MNYKGVVRVVSIALVLALMLTLGAGYAQGEERPDWLIAETVTIIDAAGREVTIKKPVERIAFTHYSMAEALKIVGAWDRVVGRDGYTLDPIIYPNINELPPVVQPMNCYAVNYEKVFELRPDIFLAAYIPMPGFEEMVAKLEPDIPVVALNLWDPDTIEENFRKLGLILDAEDEAEEFLDFYGQVEADISAVTSKIPEEEKPRVFHKTGWGADVAELMSYSDDLPGFPFRNETTGSINIAADLPSMGGWIQNVDPEWLVEQNPDIVVDTAPFPGVFGLGVDDTSAVEPIRNAIMELDVFSGGSAVRNGDVYVIAPDFFGTPRYIVGLAYQAKWFHPDLFADLDPQAIHQEYLTRFMRIDYDLSKHGVFVYPEP